MSLSTASRASTKWLWQQALIRAGGQDIATQLRERRIGCSSINDWLPASSRFSEIVWQLMAFAPTNVSSYFWFSVWEFVGARPLTVFPHTRSVHFFFPFSDRHSSFHLHSLRSSAGPEKEKKKKCCAGTSCWVDRRPAGKKKKEMWSGRLSQQLLLFLFLFVIGRQ
jgi:hypothetical protein